MLLPDEPTGPDPWVPLTPEVLQQVRARWEDKERHAAVYWAAVRTVAGHPVHHPMLVRLHVWGHGTDNERALFTMVVGEPFSIPIEDVTHIYQLRVPELPPTLET